MPAVSRRRGRRFGARSRRPLGNPLYGLHGFDGAMSLGTAVGAGITGAAVSGLTFLVVFRYDGVPTGTERFVRTLTGTTGYIMSLSNTGTVTASTGNGTASAAPPSKALTAADIGKVHVACISHDLSNVFMYFDRVQQGVSTAQTGYTPALGERMTIGATAGGASPLTKAAILGVCGRNSPIALADYQTICDASKDAGRLALGGITMSHMYSAPQGGAMPSTILDTIGTDHLTFQSGSAANLDVVPVTNSWAF